MLLFDLGGVIVELAGVPVWKEWTGQSDHEIWERWLYSPAVRRFERGSSSSDEFAREIVREFDLPVDPATFLAQFERWPTGPFPGALELLAELEDRFRLACLSNSNALHWPRFLSDMHLGEAFHHHFVSHELGALKPDLEVFELVVERLGCAPERILFLDDNQLNVDGARAAGLHAERAEGVAGAREVLREQSCL